MGGALALVFRNHNEVSRARAFLKISDFYPNERSINKAFDTYVRAHKVSCRGTEKSPNAGIAKADAAMQVLLMDLAERTSPDRSPAIRGGRGRARSDDSKEEKDEEDAKDVEDGASNSETEDETRSPSQSYTAEPVAPSSVRASSLSTFLWHSTQQHLIELHLDLRTHIATPLNPAPRRPIRVSTNPVFSLKNWYASQSGIVYIK